MKVCISNAELIVGPFGFCFGKNMILCVYNSMGSTLCGISTNSWLKRTYDSSGNCLSYVDSTDYWYKRTYDSSGNCLSYVDSNGRAY